jgi:hypothetical protein
MKRERSCLDLLPSGVEMGKKYKLNISSQGVSSLTSSSGLLALQYTFKPSTIDTMLPGALTIDSTSGESTLLLSQKEEQSIEFRGSLMGFSTIAAARQQSADSHFHLLTFDSEVKQFKLRSIQQAVIGLRQSTDDSIHDSTPLAVSQPDPSILLKKFLLKAKQNNLKKVKAQTQTKTGAGARISIKIETPLESCPDEERKVVRDIPDRVHDTENNVERTAVDGLLQ